MQRETTLYLQLSEHVEMRVTLQTRFFNGIDSDPRTITREPSFGEVVLMLDKLKRQGTDALGKSPNLDYPEKP